MTIKNARATIDDDLRPEYDLSQLKGGVRGKYYERATTGTTLVLLEPDVAAAFPDGRTVNEALRALIKVADSRIPGKPAGKPLQPASRARRRATVRKPRPAARG